MCEPQSIDKYDLELQSKHPFGEWSQMALLEEGKEIVTTISARKDKWDPLLEPLSFIWAELKGDRRREINQVMARAGIVPIRWIKKVKTTVEGMRFAKTPGGNGHVYFVLLCQDHVVTAKGPGLYIGQSRYTPQRRFENHQTGKNASRHVYKGGKFLLKSLSGVFKPVSVQESRRIEKHCLDSFRGAGLRNLPAKIIRGG